MGPKRPADIPGNIRERFNTNELSLQTLCLFSGNKTLLKEIWHAYQYSVTWPLFAVTEAEK